MSNLCTFNVLHTILELLKQQNKKQKELCDYLDISKNVFTDWKSGRNKSYLKYLPQISEFFNVSVDYLLGRTDIKKAPSDENAAADIRFIKITECYNKLNDTGKQKAVEAVSDLTEIDKYTNDNLSDDPVKKERYVIGHTAAFGGNTHDTLIPESDLDEIERLKFKLREKRIDGNKNGKK